MTTTAIEVSKPTTTFVARTAQELAQCQTGLMDWARQRIAEMRADVAECQEQESIAKRNKWAVAPWRRRKNMALKRETFYEKCLAALEAGYVIVPNMPIDLFAVRTTKTGPRSQVERWSHNMDGAQTDRPVVGDGEYVSSAINVRNYPERISKTAADGTKSIDVVDQFHASSFRDVEYPLDVAQPVIMEKVGNTMERRIFDEIGVCRDAGSRAGGDPFVIGRISDPRPSRVGLSFFIAWNLDVSRL